MASWAQPMGDMNRRVTIPHATATSQSWALDSAYTFFEGRVYPVGARGEHITAAWSVSATWSPGERGDAEAFISLLQDVATEADARLDVHVGDPANGTAIEFVGEAHDVPQQLQAGSTSVEVTFTQVDDS